MEYKWVTVVKLEQEGFLIVDYSGGGNWNYFGQAVESCYINICHRVLENRLACFSHVNFLYSDCGNLRPWNDMLLDYSVNSHCGVSVCARQTVLRYADL